MRQRLRSQGPAFATALVAFFALVGCGTEEASSTPDVCASVESLKSSVADLKNVDLAQGALVTLQEKLTKVQEDLGNVMDDARSEYATEAEAIDHATASVSTSLQAATAAPSVATVAAVGTAVQSLGTSLAALQDAVESTC